MQEFKEKFPEKYENLINNLETVAQTINLATTSTDNNIRSQAENTLNTADKLLMVFSMLHILEQENNI